MSKHFGPSADIRILKVAWGGTSLAKDWRPPSSVAKYGGVVGWCYTNFTAHVHAELSKLESPELVGVVWHQGWNDGCQASMVAEYERNLANLIRDIRSEFKSSYGTPLFSIPVSGLDAWRGRVARRNGIIHAQYAVSTYPEFQNNVASQETRGFVRFYDETGGACNQGYHFNCNGETYFYVGTVAGQAMSMLLNGTWVQPFINTTNPDDEADVEAEAEDERACRAERDGRRLLSPSANSTSRVGAWRERFGLGPYQSGKEERNAAALAAVIASRGFHVGDPKLYGFNAHEANKYSDGRRLSSSVDAVVAWRERFGIGPYESDAEERIRSALVAAAIARGERLSPYSDRTPEEYAEIFTPLGDDDGGLPGYTEYPFTPFSEGYVKRALKEGIDWRAKGVTTPIKSQGPHGVCGTFGQVQSAESQYAIGGGGSNPRKTPRPLTQFSEQQLLSCKPSSGGGEAYEFFHVGLESSADYPFNLSHWPDKDPPPCHLDRSKLLPGSIFTNRTSVPKKAGEEQLAAFIYHNGPMQVGISSHVFKGMARAGAEAFIPWEMCSNLTQRGIDHSLGVVGFGTHPEHGDYWIIRNSWGHKWADHGYVYLPRGFDGGEGWNGYCGHFMASGAHVYTMGEPRYYYEV